MSKYGNHADKKKFITSGWACKGLTFPSFERPDELVDLIFASSDTLIIYYGHFEYALNGNFHKYTDKFLLAQQLLTHCQQNNVHVHITLNKPPEQFFEEPHSASEGVYYFKPLVDAGVFTIEYISIWLSDAPNSFFREVLKNNKLSFTRQSLDYTFSCFNRHTHEHRCITLDRMARQDLLHSNLVTYLFTDENYSEDTWHRTRNEFGVTWQPTLLDPEGIIEHEQQFDLWPNISKYTQCFVDVVTESTCEAYFITEKTVRPLLFAQPFLVISRPGYHMWLQDEWGFQLYDEIFDYSFDSIEEVDKRIEAVVDQLVKFENMSKSQLLELRNSVQEKIEYNFYNLFECQRRVINTLDEDMHFNYGKINVCSKPYHDHGLMRSMINKSYQISLEIDFHKYK